MIYMGEKCEMQTSSHLRAADSSHQGIETLVTIGQGASTDMLSPLLPP
jgi:hypothetical protein